MLGRMKSLFSTKPEAVALPKNAVPMPEAGEGAYVLISLPEMEQLEASLGEQYWMLCEVGFRHPAPAVISRALAICLHGGDMDSAPWGLSIQQIGRRLFDAQLRTLKGITLAEAEAAIEEAKP